MHLLFRLLGAVVDPTKKGCTKVAVDFEIKNLLKRFLAKHNTKETETSVKPDEDPRADDHGESILNFDRYYIYMLSKTLT